jgi:hypothetical protein
LIQIISFFKGFELSAVKVAAQTPKQLVPGVAESSTATGARRVRLSKALAAIPTKKPGRKHSPAKQSKRDEARSGKVKLRSERYTIPDNEYAQLTALKKRLLTLGVSAKKSQLLRAGLLLLAAMGDARLKTAVAKTELATLRSPKVTKNA